MENLKINSISLVALLIWIFTTCLTYFFADKEIIFIILYTITMIYIFYLLYLIYSNRINIFSIVFIIAFSILLLINQSKYTFSNTVFLLIAGVLHFIIALCSLHLIYHSKRQNNNLTRNNIIIFLLLILMTITNFSSIYSSLQYIGLPDMQHLFEIDNGIEGDVFPMGLDFFYYSSDTFFGTNISNVKINYLDYTDINEQINNRHYNEKRKFEIQSKFNLTSVLLELVKIISLLESLSFLLFISIIVLNLPDENWINKIE